MGCNGSKSGALAHQGPAAPNTRGNRQTAERVTSAPEPAAAATVQPDMSFKAEESEHTRTDAGSKLAEEHTHTDADSKFVEVGDSTVRHSYSSKSNSISRANSALKTSHSLSRCGSNHHVSFRESKSMHIKHAAEDVAENEGYRRSPSLQKSLRGGEEVAMKKIVDLFYVAVLDDATLAPFFAHVNVDRIKAKQMKIMGLAFGDQELFIEQGGMDGENLRKHHMRMLASQERPLTIDHWERFVDLFKTVISKLEIPEDVAELSVDRLKDTKEWFVAPTAEELAALAAQETS